MHKYWKHPRVPMTAKSGLVLLLCLTISAHAQAPDVVSRIRTIASEHSAGTVATSTATYYRVYAVRPPRGYRAVVTLIAPAEGTSSLVAEIDESIGGDEQITRLVDLDADGHLDYVLAARASSLEEATRALSSGVQPVPPTTEEQAIYDRLLDAIRAQPLAREHREYGHRQP